MKYNPQIHHRRSIRLKNYDYSQAGLYFITICIQNRACLLGEIENGEMILNDAGKMIEHWYYELENKFNDIKCHEMVVMPNHFHCIVENTGMVAGADLRVCPNDSSDLSDSMGETNISGEQSGEQSGEINSSGEHTGSPQQSGSPLYRVVQWFKTMTTNHYIRGVKQHKWQPFNGKLWQRNYWEHIIRNDNEYQRISNYIMNNPKNWGNDKLM